MRPNNLTFNQKLGLIIMMLAGPTLALFYWGTGILSGWPLSLLLTIAAIGGSVGMAIYAPPQIRRLGFISGILIGLGSFGLPLFYSSFRSSSKKQGQPH